MDYPAAGQVGQQIDLQLRLLEHLLVYDDFMTSKLGHDPIGLTRPIAKSIVKPQRQLRAG
jgi:hypothetical protein